MEFGAKLDIGVVDGWACLECYSFDAYNEAGNLKVMTERFRERGGHYPARILADKIYRNPYNLSYCKEHGIRLSSLALGRPKKGESRNRLRITKMNTNAWKWGADSVWQSASAALGWSLQD